MRAFLTQRPFLISLLFEAHQEAARFFAGASLRLELVIDPENFSDRHLVVSILTPLPADKAVEQLQAFDTTWWLDALDRSRGALSISITSHRQR